MQRRRRRDHRPRPRVCLLKASAAILGAMAALTLAYLFDHIGDRTPPSAAQTVIQVSAVDDVP